MSFDLEFAQTLNLVFSLVTTVCALYLSYAALVHSARPRVKVSLKNNAPCNCGSQIKFIFEFVNIGHWYASPTAIDLVVFFNFVPAFELKELRYGSAQLFIDAEVKQGV